MKKLKKPPKNNSLSNILSPILLVLSMGIILYGLFNKIIPNLHDVNTFFWAKAFFEVFKSGAWYPRWIPQLWYGFGLPVFYIYNPLFYFSVLGFQLIGLGTIVSIKSILVISTLTGAYSMYLLAKEFVNKNTVILAPAIFVLAPYYISLVYVRGAFPEFMALNLLPWLFWCLTKLFKEINETKYLLLSIVSLALIVLTHNLTAAIAIFLTIIYALYWFVLKKYNYKILIKTFWAFIVTGLLTAIYWLPVLFNLPLINSAAWTSDKYFFAKHFPTVLSLLNLSLSQALGWVTIGIIPLLILATGWVTYSEILNWIKKRNILFVLILTTFFVFLVTPLSDFLWTNIPGMDIFQFPARFIGISILLIAILAVLLLEELITSKNQKIWTVNVLIIVMMVLALPFVKITDYRNMDFIKESNLDVNKYFSDLVQNSNDKKTIPGLDRGVIAPEYLPRKISNADAEQFWVDTIQLYLEEDENEEKLILSSYKKITTGSENITIDTINESFFDNTYNIEAQTDGKIKINQFEYPTWEIRLDGNLANTYIEDGIAGQFIDVPEGEHTLSVKLIKQSYEKIGEYISLAGLVLLLSGFVLTRKRKK